jgi:hypothetical protein
VGNLEIMQTLLPETDMVAFAADPTSFVEAGRAAALHPEIRSRWIAPGQTSEYTGLAGFVEGWRDWVEPYSSYMLAIEDLIDLGERVVSFVRVVAVTRHDGVELTHAPAAVWTVRDGKVVEVAFHLDRDEALAGARAQGSG